MRHSEFMPIAHGDACQSVYQPVDGRLAMG